MKMNRVFKHMKSITEPQVMILSPGPIKLNVTPLDGIGIKVLELIAEELGEDARIGDMMDILFNAQWWLTFYSAMAVKEDEPDE